MSRTLRPATAVALALVLLSASLVWIAPGAAAQPAGRLVDDVPVRWTPDVLGDPYKNRVNAAVKIGSTLVLGGTFSEVQIGKETFTRHNILAFNLETRQLTSFAPKIEGTVKALAPAPGGGAVFVGGTFDYVNGKVQHKFAKLDLGTGRGVDAFHVPDINGQVRELEISGGKLYVGGDFGWVGGKRHQRLATLDPQTGAVDPFMDVQVTGKHNGGFTNVRAFDISPDGNRLVAVGNFNEVDGVRRDQLAMIDLSGASAELATWRTTRYRGECGGAFDTYMRDVAFSPGGSYFAVVTTGGGAHSPGALCDTATRWETDPTDPAEVEPTWIAYTGRDTLTEVAIAGGVVYIGGHQRWFNNPRGTDHAGPGAVPRPGLAALDPDNGLPLAWNPGRIPRGYGVTDVLVTDRGLWVGSDTEFIGHYRYRRERIAFFPFAGGTVIPQAKASQLPGDVYLPGSGSVLREGEVLGGEDGIRYRSYDGETVSGSGTIDSGGLDEGTVRGAFLVGETLWYGSEDGDFYRAGFDGQSFGPPVDVDPYADPESTEDDPRFPTDENRPIFPGKEPRFYDRLPRVSGMFYVDEKLYYTFSGDPNLYYRDFVPSSGILGAEQLVADTAPKWATVKGMFLSDGDLYYAAATGNLHRVGFADGHPVAGTHEVVEDTKDWAANALFLRSTGGPGGGSSPSPSPTPSKETGSPSPTPSHSDSPSPGGEGDEDTSPSPTPEREPTSDDPTSGAASDGRDNNGVGGAGGGSAPGGAQDAEAVLAGSGDAGTTESGGLPYTGFEIGLLIAVACASLVLGAGLVLLAGGRLIPTSGRAGAHS